MGQITKVLNLKAHEKPKIYPKDKLTIKICSAFVYFRATIDGAGQTFAINRNFLKEELKYKYKR